MQTELSFVDVSIVGSNALLKWNLDDLQTKVSSGCVQCRWKDQGWGNRRGKLYLNLMSPDGSEKASLAITDDVSPHDWESVVTNLVATDPVLAEATVGCWYQFRADCTNRGEHELYVEDIILQLTGVDQPVS